MNGMADIKYDLSSLISSIVNDLSSNGVLAAFLAFVVCVVFLYWCKINGTERRKRINITLEDSIKERIIPLLDSEKSSGLYVPTASMVTFYKGKAPVQYFRRTLLEIIRLNPWLAGRLKTSEQHGIYLTCPSTVGVDLDLDRHLQVLESFALGLELDYESICTRLAPMDIPLGRECINKDVVLFKVILLQIGDQSEDLFAFGLSMSHVIGDGYTLYKIYSMFDMRTEPTMMIADRDFTFPGRLRSTIGSEAAGLTASVMSIIALLSTALLYGLPRMLMMRVDDGNVLEVKSRYNQAAKNSNNINSSSNSIPDFISTNDIITSYFLQAATSYRLTVPIMAANMRGRIEGACEDMAGNYEAAIPYPSAADYSSPESIRKSLLNGFRAVSGDAASPWMLLRRGATIVTNWSSFYTHITIPREVFLNGQGGGAGESHSRDFDDSVKITSCEHIAHLPLGNARNASVFNDMLVIFKPDKDSTALIVCTRNLTLDHLRPIACSLYSSIFSK